MAEDQTLSAIRTLGRLLDDIERLRVANQNRLGALQREFGGTLPQLEAIQERLDEIEQITEKELLGAWKSHPLASWQKDTLGLGGKSMARLISVIGDPAERPNPAKLWAYCGYGDPARITIPKGAVQAELLARGNPEAKKRVWLIVRSFVMKENSPYRSVYEQAKERYEGRDWTPGHKDAAARRFVAKRFLKDLWIESRKER